MKESQNIEWKESWRDEYLKWICGFANAQGGKIYIGVNDNGEVIGINNSKQLSEELPNKILQTLGIVADVNELEEDGKDYIEIVVKASSFPINYKGEYHYRTGSTKQQLKGIALTEFLTNKTGIRWEDITVDDVTVEDLDKDSFDIFRREALKSKRMTKADLKMSNEQLLDSLHLISNGKLTRAAVMLFHRDPEKWVTGCYTKIGKFGIGSDLQYQDEIHGSLFLQAERVIELIYLKYLKGFITYDGIVRVETFPFSKDAVREAYYNALIHSCWSSGVPVQIRIEDSAMYISNDCVFPSDWTVETLYNRHRSRPYNPNIAGAFFRAGYVETWGRGIQKICEACEQYGVSNPEYIIHSEDIMVKIIALQNTAQSTAQTAQSAAQLLEVELNIIKVITRQPDLSQRKIAEEIGETYSSVRYHMDKMLNAGVLTKEKSGKKIIWNVISNN